MGSIPRGLIPVNRCVLVTQVLWPKPFDFRCDIFFLVTFCLH